MKAHALLLSLIAAAMFPFTVNADDNQPANRFAVHIADDDEPASAELTNFSPTEDASNTAPAPPMLSAPVFGMEIAQPGASPAPNAAPIPGPSDYDSNYDAVVPTTSVPAGLVGGAYNGEVEWSGYCCEGGCRPSRGWVDVEYLLWTLQEQEVPALVTSSPFGTPRDAAGVLGQPGTTILFGGGGLDEDPRSGARLRFGAWFDDCQQFGIEGVLFGLEDHNTNFSASSEGNPALGRPVFNVDPLVNAQDAVLVAFDTPAGVDVFDGGVLVSTTSELSSAEALFRSCAGWVGAMRFDLLSGYRYFQLDEGINIFQSTTFLDPAGPVGVGTVIDTLDSFTVENDFHGGELGLAAHQEGCRWSLDFGVKVALGQTTSKVRVNGGTRITDVNGVETLQVGGVLARGTNMGNYEEKQFSVLPEANIKLGYRLTENLTATAGYTFLYVNKLARPGDQINTTINGTRLDNNIPAAGPLEPAFNFTRTDLWAQGLTAGMTWNY